MRLLACLEGLEGLPFIALPHRFAAAVDELVGDRRSVACRVTWRPRELADERGDKLARLPGAGGEPGWLERRRHGRGLHAAVS